DAANARLLGTATQEARVEAGVEVEGVEHLVERILRRAPRPDEFALRGGDGAHGPGGNVRHRTALPLAQVELVEGDALQVLAERPERMEVAVAELAPVHELDAELERRPGLADEIVLVDSDQRVEAEQGRDGGLADADDADLLGLDQRDPR